ncbi:MAG: molybdopterin molybdotransferase MoeA [Candidatus Obscuribacterales bacterium]|nr:molybdopterin molybdotransferase MoeA [Steroidobacteraceae bacterium]
MLSPADATAAIESSVPRLPTSAVALRDAAGCVLQQVVVAERDQPPFNRVSMDGIAIASASKARAFRIAGTQAAGAAPLALANDNECTEAMTGAMLPTGCDCVIPVERITIRDGYAHLATDVAVSPWLNIHRRGVDCRAGVEVLRPGIRLTAPEVAVLASAGLVHVKVARAPRIVVISTGDELVEPGAPMAEWQIRRSNVYAVLATLRAHGYSRLADDHLLDDEQQLRDRLRKHLNEADVLILSGGVSMGKFDFVPRILMELGVREIFHKIAQRPGKPMWFGVRDDGKAVYALPGNPVSTLVCLTRYVLPGLRAASGASVSTHTLTQLAQPYRTLPNLWSLLPVKLHASSAEPRPTHGSGDFTSLTGTDGFIELPPGVDEVARGTTVNFYRW